MPHIKHVIESNYSPTFRSEKIAGMFDVQVSNKLRKEWDLNVPIEEKPWRIGLIVGASGAGKTTIAKQLFGESIHSAFNWSAPCLLDDFPESISMEKLTAALSKVGFSSPPSWLLPYSALSNGQKFRVELARCLFEYPDFFVVDEFTSIVDRQVAQIGAYAFQKAIRSAPDQRFVAVTCHYDVEPWLQPDWVLDVSTGEFKWGSLRRPEINFEIRRVNYSAWHLFKDHHYLTKDINKASFCFVGFLEGRPVCFSAWLPFFGRLKKGKARRAHRTVTLPDFQGLGLGNLLVNTISEMWCALGYRVFYGTAHPAEIKKRVLHPSWRLTRQGRSDKDSRQNYGRAIDRLIARFEFVGSPMFLVDAQNLLGE